MELVAPPTEPISVAKSWILAIRPKTLWAAIIPVMIGSSMAASDGAFHLPAAAAALLSALAIQIGTNLVNDHADFSKGADTSDRKGPVRVTQAGLLSPEKVMGAAIASFIIAVVIGAYLIFRGGWPVLVIGIASVLSGYLYTAGPRPLGYLGLGDLFVLIFFGPVAVGGTYYVQALDINWIVIVAGFAPGLLSVALLAVNNLRDIDEDAAAGKKTLAVRFGHVFARAQYIGCVLAAVLIPVFLFAVTGNRPWTLLTLVVLVASLPAFRTLWEGIEGRDLIPLLGSTAKLSILFAILFSVTWML